MVVASLADAYANPAASYPNLAQSGALAASYPNSVSAASYPELSLAASYPESSAAASYPHTSSAVSYTDLSSAAVSYPALSSSAASYPNYLTSVYNNELGNFLYNDELWELLILWKKGPRKEQDQIKLFRAKVERKDENHKSDIMLFVK